jgi:hypothetical protein
MGAPDRGDRQGSDRAGALGARHRLSPASADIAVGSCSHWQPALGPRPSEVRWLARARTPSRVAAAVSPDTLGLRQTTFHATIARRSVHACWALQLFVLLVLRLLLPAPALAQPAPVGGGPDPGIHPAYGYPPMNSGAYGAYPSASGNEPRFDYVVPSPQGSWDPGRPPAQLPGNTGYASTDIPDYAGFPGSDPSLPVFSGSVGPYSGAHVGAGERQGNEGFRFRGDKAVSDAPWHESPSVPGYRFRPVSPEELARSAGSDGWRPIRPDDGRAAERDQPARPGGDAFGYQSDSWFRRYYGERP